MKKINRHEIAVERKLDQIIELLSTQPRNVKHDDERMAHLRNEFKKKILEDRRRKQYGKNIDDLEQ